MLVYMATNLVTNLSYIGATVGSLRGRRSLHEWEAANRGAGKFHQAILDYGPKAFVWRILVDGITSKSLLDAEESRCIAIFETYLDGYNSTPSGRGGVSHSEESRLKMTQSQRKRRSTSDVSEETRQRLAEAGRRRASRSEETKQKVSAAMKKVWQSTPNRVHSEESKQKMSESHKKRHAIQKENLCRPS